MRPLRRVFARLRALLTWRQQEQRLQEEFEEHIALLTEDNLRTGRSPVEARRQATLKFGSVEAAKEEYRDARGLPWLESLWQDARFALRMMRRAPGFTTVAVLSLALGIGANTAIFSLINILMLRQIPVRDPGQLVEVLQQYPGDPRLNGFSPEEYQYIRDHNDVFSGVIATLAGPVSMRGEDGTTETVYAETVTGNYFPLLGVKPVLGRLIEPEDDRADSTPVAVVSWSYWKARFNLDPGVVGKQIIVRDAPATIVGVTPEEFSGLRTWLRPQVWLSGGAGGCLVGRLKPGVSIEQAETQAAVLYRRAQRLAGDPLWDARRFELEPAGAGISLPVLSDRYAGSLVTLMAVVGLLLLLACANVGGMLLARGAAREREMSLRVSLGAGRWRLVRQVLTESLLLSAVGTMVGVFLAWFGAVALIRVVLSGRRIPGLPETIEIAVQPDLNVLLFASGVGALTGLLFGLAPALRALATAPASSLRAAGRSGETSHGRRFGKALVVAQVALSVVLLSSAGLFVQRLSALRNNLGFQRDHLVLVTLNPSGSGLDRRQLTLRYRELLDRLAAIPGVRSATLCGPTPISGAGASRFVTAEGHQESPEDRRYVSLARVAPKYFETLGTPLLAGRDFSFQDQGRSRVAIVNQTMARYYFGDESPIGKHITIDRNPRNGGWYGDDQPYEVVGVVGDAKYYDPGEAPHRTLYFNAFQEDRIESQFILRTSVDPSAVVPGARHAVQDVLKTVPLERVTTMAAQVDAALVPERLIAMLSGTFGALGSLLAAIGVYGLLAYTVAYRTNEIGVRMALGATRGDVGRMVLSSALRMAIAGLAIGVLLASWSRNLASHVIADLPLANPIPIAFAGAAMVAVALLAAYMPARRASRVDPVVALRWE